MLLSRILPMEPARARAVLLSAALACAGCDFSGDPLVILPEFDDTTSFETDLGKWTGRAIDLGTPPATWEVVRSGDRATQGTQSARLRLGNLAAGQTKVFIERRYEVEKNQTYQVDFSFDLASADWSGVTPWALMAGVMLDSPAKTGAVVTPGTTATGRATNEGYIWLQKSYSMDVTSDADGELFVFVGVVGASEVSRTYYVDNVKVTLTRKGISPPR